MSNKVWLWTKMLSLGGILMIGGPALVVWVSPTEEELFKKYNPELQKRSLEGREQRQEEFNQFVGKLKDYSKHPTKPIWVVAKEEEDKMRADKAAEQRRVAEEIQRRRDEIRRHAMGVEK
ncbi:assembly factor cbp4 [Puttea exsequens]|nr:assembly factor cbp4 [Puttea exsequens]